MACRKGRLVGKQLVLKIWRSHRADDAQWLFSEVCARTLGSRWAVWSECGARGAPPPAVNGAEMEWLVEDNSEAVNGEVVEELTDGFSDGVWAPRPHRVG